MDSLNRLRLTGTAVLLGLFVVIHAISCRQSVINHSVPGEEMKVEYAKGFRIIAYKHGHVLYLRTSIQDSTEGLWYGFAPDTSALRQMRTTWKRDTGMDWTAGLVYPVERLVSNSTTHVAALERLDELQRLSGFAQAQLVSSSQARHYIEAGSIREVGMGGSYDPERLLQVDPDLILTSGPQDVQKELQSPAIRDIPSLSIVEWLEESPLGRAEWIKVFGLITGRLDESVLQFERTRDTYAGLKAKADSTVKGAPWVISGSLFKDVFYAPGGESWMAVLIEDAGGQYIWSDNPGTRSLQLSAEKAVSDGLGADLWLGCGQYEHLGDLRASHPLLVELNSVRKGQVFTYMGTRGPTGGVLFFEEAAYRPDWLLDDAIRILQSNGTGDKPEGLRYFSILKP